MRIGKVRATIVLVRRSPLDDLSADSKEKTITDMPGKILDKLHSKLGFIGLGLMGSRLTRRLHSTGWNIRAWNRSAQPAEELNKAGIATETSCPNLVAESDVILSCLANDAAVRSVYFDKDGVFSAAEPGTVILEMSTISPELSRSLHQEARAKGLNLLDVAISGSTPAVDADAVQFLVATVRRLLAESQPVKQTA